MIGDAAMIGRQPGDAREPDPFPLQRDDDVVVGKGAISERGDAVLPAFILLHRYGAASVMFQREGNVGARHGEAADDIEAGGIFRPSRAQELAAGRHLPEKLLDTNPGAGGNRRRAFRL